MLSLSLGTGYIGIDEFILLVTKKMQDDEDERELKDVFRVLDKERKGEIDVNELRWILKNLGDDLTEEEIDDMITDTDTDGSGFVDYDGGWPVHVHSVYHSMFSLSKSSNPYFNNENVIGRSCPP